MKIRKSLAAVVAVVGILAAAITSIETELDNIRRQLAQTELIIKKERIQAKHSNLTWADVRRMISADIKLRQELRRRTQLLKRDEAYFQALKNKFANLVRRTELGAYQARNITELKEFVERWVLDSQRATNYEEAQARTKLEHLKKYAKLSPRHRELLVKISTSPDLVSGSEWQELETKEDLLGTWRWDDFTKAKEQEIANLQLRRTYYLDLLIEAEQYQKPIQKLIGFIEQNQLQELLKQELSALYGLENSLQAQLKEYEDFLQFIEESVNELSVLQLIEQD